MPGGSFLCKMQFCRGPSAAQHNGGGAVLSYREPHGLDVFPPELSGFYFGHVDAGVGDGCLKHFLDIDAHVLRQIVLHFIEEGQLPDAGVAGIEVVESAEEDAPLGQLRFQAGAALLIFIHYQEFC